MADSFLDFPEKTALTLSSSAKLVGINGEGTDEFSIEVGEFLNFIDVNVVIDNADVAATASILNTSSSFAGFDDDSLVSVGWLNSTSSTPNLNTNSLAFVDDNGFLSASNSVPTSISSSGVESQTAFDSNYFYLCVAPNTWRRTAMGVF